MRCPLRLPWFILLAFLGLAAALAPARAGTEAAGPETERWYEILRHGQKLGSSRVVWAPSTWEGKPTVHDTTVITERSVRNMMGMKDVFETITTIDLERGDDGTLWWMRVILEEAGRRIVEEQAWTGAGYRYTSRLGDEEARVVEIPLDAPVATDAEAYLGSRIRAGAVSVGDRFDLRLLDLRARKARVVRLAVAGRETVSDLGEGPDALVEAFRVVETDPRTGAETTLWIDDDGAFVKLVTDSGAAYRRVSREMAETRPVRPAELRITTPSTPVLERVMSADALWLDLHVQGDADRKEPAFPASPWSRTTAVTGSDEEGWVYAMALSAYDDPDADTTLPIDPAPFAKDLEATVLMQCDHADVRAAAEAVIGEETSARKAAYLLSRWVFETLDKTSPAVGQASALEILESERGDCSEHALLYVALCRAAGIPARRCSGYVNVGSDWGAHAWAEVWVGAWIGADPTTGEIGTAARYVFFGYSDDPESHPGLVSARASGRLRFVATKIREGEETWDLEDPEDWHVHDAENGRYVNVLAGIEARDVPKDWVVRMVGPRSGAFRAEGFRAHVDASADQGYDLRAMRGFPEGRFAGMPARVLRTGGGQRHVFVHSRRRIVHLTLSGEAIDDQLPTLEKILAPTFADPPKKP